MEFHTRICNKFSDWKIFEFALHLLVKKRVNILTSVLCLFVERKFYKFYKWLKLITDMLIPIVCSMEVSSKYVHCIHLPERNISHNLSSDGDDIKHRCRTYKSRLWIFQIWANEWSFCKFTLPTKVELNHLFFKKIEFKSDKLLDKICFKLSIKILNFGKVILNFCKVSGQMFFSFSSNEN